MVSPDRFSSFIYEKYENRHKILENKIPTTFRNFFGTWGDKSAYEKGSIAIARQVFPSDILKLVSAGIQGIILASGGVTSHVTILARSLQLPLIIAEEPGLLSLSKGTTLLME